MAAESSLKDSLKVAPSQNSVLARAAAGEIPYDDRDVNWLRGDSAIALQPTLVVVSNIYGYAAIVGQKGLDIVKVADIKNSVAARSSLYSDGTYDAPKQSIAILPDAVIDALSLSSDEAFLAVRIGTEGRVYRFSDLVHNAAKLSPVFTVQFGDTSACRQFWGWSKPVPSKFMYVSNGNTCTITNGEGVVEREHKLPFAITAACWHGDSILCNSSSGGVCSFHPGSSPTPVCGPPTIPGPQDCIHLLHCDAETVLGVWAAREGDAGGNSLFVGALDRQSNGSWSLQMLPTAFPALGGDYPLSAQTCSGEWLPQWNMALFACNCMSKVAMLMRLPARSVPGKSSWIVQDPADTDILIPTCTNAQGWQETVIAGMAVLTADVGLGRVPKSALVTAAADDVYDLGPAILLHASNGVCTTFHCVPDGKQACPPFQLTAIKQVPAPTVTAAAPPAPFGLAATAAAMPSTAAVVSSAFGSLPAFGAGAGAAAAAPAFPAFGAPAAASSQPAFSFGAAAPAALPVLPAAPAPVKPAVSMQPAPVPAPAPPPVPLPAATPAPAPVQAVAPKTKTKVTVPEPTVPIVPARSVPSSSSTSSYKGWRESHAGFHRTLTSALAQAGIGTPTHQYITQLQAAIDRCDGVVKGLAESSSASSSSAPSRAQESSILTALSALGPAGVYDTARLREAIQGAERMMQGSAQPKAEAARLASAVASSVVSRAEEAARRASTLASGRVPGAPLSLPTPAMSLDPWTEEACRRARTGVSMLSARIQTLQAQVDRCSSLTSPASSTLLDLASTARKLDVKAAAEQDRVQQVKAAVEALSKELSMSVSVDMIADRIRSLATTSTSASSSGASPYPYSYSRGQGEGAADQAVAESKEAAYGEDRRGYSMPRHLRRSPSYGRSSYATTAAGDTASPSSSSFAPRGAGGGGRFTSPMRPVQLHATATGMGREEGNAYDIPQGALSLLRPANSADASYSRPSWSLTRVPSRLQAEGRAYALTTALWGPPTGAAGGQLQQPQLRYTRFAAPSAVDSGLGVGVGVGGDTPHQPLGMPSSGALPAPQVAAPPSALQAVLAAAPPAPAAGLPPAQPLFSVPPAVSAAPVAAAAAAPPTLRTTAAGTAAFSLGATDVGKASAAPPAAAAPAFSFGSSAGSGSTGGNSAPAPAFGGLSAFGPPTASATGSGPLFGDKKGTAAGSTFSFGAPAAPPVAKEAPVSFVFGTAAAAPAAAPVGLQPSSSAATAPAPSSANKEKEEVQARKMLKKYKTVDDYVDTYVERKHVSGMCRYVSEGSAVPEHRGLAQEMVEALVTAVLQEDEERSFEDCWAALQSRCGGAPTTPYMPSTVSLQGEGRERYAEYERIVRVADGAAGEPSTTVSPAKPVFTTAAVATGLATPRGGLNRALQFGTPAPADTTSASTIAGGPLLGVLDTTAASTMTEGMGKDAAGGAGTTGATSTPAPSAFAFGAAAGTVPSFPGLGLGAVLGGAPKAAGSAFSFGATNSSSSGAAGGPAAAPAPAPTAPPSLSFGLPAPKGDASQASGAGKGGGGSGTPEADKAAAPAAAGNAFSFGSFGGALSSAPPPAPAFGAPAAAFGGFGTPAPAPAPTPAPSATMAASDPSFPGIIDARELAHLRKLVEYMSRANPANAAADKVLKSWAKNGCGLWDTLKGKYGAAVDVTPFLQGLDMSVKPAGGAATGMAAPVAVAPTAPATAASGFGAFGAGMGSGTSAFGAPAAAPAPAFSGFGAPAPASSAFGAAAPAPAFGGFGAPAPASSAFGAAAPAPAFGGFGTPAPASSAFGSPPAAAPAPSPFGGFGAAAPAPAFGAPAAAPAPVFGAFGAPAAAPAAAPSAFGGFGAPAPAATGFGASIPAFGAAPAAPAFGGGAGAFSFGGSTGGFMAAGLRK